MLYGKINHKQCYTCGRTATTVYYDRPMCLQCAAQAAKYSKVVKDSIAKERDAS